MIRQLCFYIVTSFILVTAPPRAWGECPDVWLPGQGISSFDGPVYAMTLYDSGEGPRLYAGGDFARAGGVLVNNIAQWDGMRWSSLGSGVDDTVHALSVYNGELIVGGYFTSAGGVSVNHIACWDGAAWTPLGSGMGPEDDPSGQTNVAALTIYNSELIAAGRFTTAGGMNANRIARWNGSSWSSLGSGMNERVYALSVYNGDLFAAGRFTTAGSASATRIARWDGTTWSALGTGITGSDPPWFPVVRNLAVHNGELIAGGHFTAAGGVVAKHIARWDGTMWFPLADGLSYGSPVTAAYSIIVHNGRLMVGGEFSRAGNVSANHIASWDGTEWQPLGSGTGARVNAMIAYNGDLVAGGDFTTAGYISCGRVARWDGAGWSPVGGAAIAEVSALSVYSGELIAAGNFSSAGGVECNRMARWNGTHWNPLGSGMDAAVSDLIVYSGKLIAAGSFTTAGTVPANHIASWDGIEWQPLGSGTNERVGALAVYNGDLIAGGDFTTAGSVQCNRIARWNGTQWNPLGSGMDSEVTNLTVYSGELIAAGSFTTAGTVAANRIASWDETQWQSLGSGINGWVGSLAVFNGELIAGGLFDSAGGVTAKSITRWNGAEWSGLGGGVSDRESCGGGFVRSLAVYNGDLIAGGRFIWASGVTVNHIARWDGASWSSLSIGVDPDVSWCPDVTVLQYYDGDLFAAGAFLTVDGRASAHWARWRGCPPGDVNLDGNVRMDDLTGLVTCLEGPGQAALVGCHTADLDASGGIDLRDIALFQAAFAGAS